MGAGWMVRAPEEGPSAAPHVPKGSSTRLNPEGQRPREARPGFFQEPRPAQRPQPEEPPGGSGLPQPSCPPPLYCECPVTQHKDT